MDITYIPMARGWVYLAAVVDWASRRVLAHRVSITMDTAFCIEALEEAFARHGQPEIFNTDQGRQFTSTAFIEQLQERGIAIDFYNARRPHSSLDRMTPDEFYLATLPATQQAA